MNAKQRRNWKRFAYNQRSAIAKLLEDIVNEKSDEVLTRNDLAKLAKELRSNT